MTTDLIARLRHAHEHSQQRIVGSNIFQEAATALEAQEANPKQLADTIRDMHAAGLELRQRAEQAERALAEALSVVESLLLSLGNNSNRVKAARRFMKEHTP